jgi:hypothetical protein
MRVHIRVCFVLWVVGASLNAADFDGDGVADTFEFARGAVALRHAKDARVVDPWSNETARRATGEGVCLCVRLSRERRSYLIRSEFFSAAFWQREPRPLKIIRPKDRAYAAWKKSAPGLKGDAIQLGTEAGIDILLYWNGHGWRVYEPPEEP